MSAFFSSARKAKWLFHPLSITTIFFLLLLLYIIYNQQSFDLILNYGHFYLLGLVGAIAANSTGAGGGIVFIPAFTSMSIEGINALGTSLAIQCFGMTAGSIVWLLSIHRHQHGGENVVKLTHQLVLIAGATSVAGMLIAQYALPQPAWHITTIFKYFSILFGLVLLVVTLKRRKHKHTQYHLRKRHQLFIVMVCFVGGMVTSWISIGVGEWLAILLFFLGYPTMVVVCVAVCVSSITVLSGISYHIFIANSISWEILLFAAPAAIIGGTIARLFAERLGPMRLKIFFSAWILATGLAMPA